MTNLALSPSGSNFDTANPVAATAGSTIVPGYDATTRQFRAMTLPAGGGGSLVNLSTVLYWDGGTTVPLADQIGNIEAPFADAQDAVDAVLGSGFLLECAPGFVQSALDIPPEASPLYIRGLAPNGAEIGTLTVEENTQVYIERLTVEAVALGAGAPLTVIGPCAVGPIVGESGNSVTLYGQANLGQGNVLYAVSSVVCQQLVAVGYQIGNITTDVDCVLQQCSVQGAPTLTIGGDLKADLWTLNRLRDAGATLVVTGNVVVLDAPTELYAEFEVTGTEGNITQIIRPCSGAKPGDTFAVALDDAPPDIMAGAPVCLVADQVRIPFYFSADGAASVVARVTRLTVGEV